MSVHSKVEGVHPAQKSAIFYQHFLPLREDLLLLLGRNYRRYFKVGLAQQSVAGSEPHAWAWVQLQPAIYAAADWICDWYILACSGENRLTRMVGSKDIVPGETASFSLPLTAPPVQSAKSWRAPAWLFSILPDLTGIGQMKQNNIPVTDSEEELGAAHTHLIVKGARRAFLSQLAEIIEIVRNEETAAAGAIPVERAIGKTRRTIRRTG